MSRKKIVIFLEYFLAPTETFVYNQLQSLSKHNDVWVFCCEIRNREIFPYEKIKVLNSRFGLRKKLRAFLENKLKFYSFRDAALRTSIKNEINNLQPDMIFSHFGPNALLWEANMTGHFPHFVMFHGYDASFLLSSSGSYRNKLKQLLAKPYIYPIFVSKALHQNAELLIKNKFHAHISRLGIDTSFYKPYTQNRKGKIVRFVQVASFVEKKGQEILLRALNKIINHDFKMIFIGDGPLLSYCKSLCHQLDLTGKVVFKGHLSRYAIKEQLAQADIFVHPSCHSKTGDIEGIPTSIMEAMAMELPILSTRHSGIPELIENGIHGILVPERNVASLAKGLLNIMDWNKMGNNRVRIERDFNLYTQCSKLDRYFNEVLGITA